MFRTSLVLILLATGIAASGNTHAQVCGATVYSSVTLTADLVCLAGVDGIVIGDHNLAIDLTGYAITPPNGTAARGIRSSGFDGLKIFGGGKIRGFGTSVMIVGGNNHEIRDIDAVGPGFGIWLRNTSGSVVEKSRVGVVELGSDPGYSASANRIAGNDADSISVWGCKTYKNVIENNDIHPSNQFMAVSLAHGATDTEVIANRIVSGTVWLGGASGNLVAGNSITSAVYPATSWIYAGVILGEHPSSCASWAIVPAIDNVVTGNAIVGAPVGVLMAAGSRQNQVVHNKIYDQRDVGLYFHANSDDNDGRGNGYRSAPGANAQPVTDLGQRNLWP